MTDPGKCTLTTNNCLINTFCPATDATEVTCLPCESISLGQECVCDENKLQVDCKTCNGKNCKECIIGTAIAFGTSCRHCPRECVQCSNPFSCDICLPGNYPSDKGCATCRINFCIECSNETTCTKCNPDKVLVGGKCLAQCKNSTDCADPAQFCDQSTSTCQYCIFGCQKCDNTSTCQTCKERFFLTPENTCKRCNLNCSSCNSTKCSSCYPGFSPQNTSCTERCHSTSDCVTAPAFCDETLCKKCSEGCKSCTNAKTCKECSEGQMKNAAGQCEVQCKELKNGQFCNKGVAKSCVEGLTAACKCGDAVNCASCDSAGTVCQTCLTGFQLVSGACKGCQAGFTAFEGLCVKNEKVVPGTCTNAENKCLADTYCPATDLITVFCASCNSLIQPGNGCNCAADTPVENCQKCTNSSCSECVSGYGLDSETCVKCAENCQKCDNGKCSDCSGGYFVGVSGACEKCSLTNCQNCPGNICTSCATGFVLDGENCVQTCQNTSQCGLSAYCDSEQQMCKACPTGCNLCEMQGVCSQCAVGKAVNLVGQCEVSCGKMANGQFCDNGVIKACGGSMSQACQCTDAQNCASCSVDEMECSECLLGFLMADGICSQCAAGYEKVNTLCLKSNGGDVVVDGGDKTKLSGGAIAGIVIAVLVVVGVIMGGLAYYFIKKNKSGKGQVSVTAQNQ